MIGFFKESAIWYFIESVCRAYIAPHELFGGLVNYKAYIAPANTLVTLLNNKVYIALANSLTALTTNQI